MSEPLAAVFGCAGETLGRRERDFFRDADPAGFIVFARNIANPDQLRDLVAELRECVGRGDAPVLIDQEGGRVARLGPPHWRRPPPAASFGKIARNDPEKATKAAWLNARLIAHDLAGLGITVDCAPVLDVPVLGAHDIIGDRAYAADPATISRLGGATADGLLAGGVLPVIKHIPGHGRAGADSHLALPIVEASEDQLNEVDFVPFRALSHLPWAMTAHIVYRAIDAERPATISAKAVGRVIRKLIGFHGLLISDDLSMKALGGTLRERARDALAAGCDLALHCNGDAKEMIEVAEGCRALDQAGAARLARGEEARSASFAAGDAAEWKELLARIQTEAGMGAAAL